MAPVGSIIEWLPLPRGFRAACLLLAAFLALGQAGCATHRALGRHTIAANVTATETDYDALRQSSQFHLDRERHDLPGINRGLFFLPR